MEEFTEEAKRLAFPKFQALLNYASLELYKYSAEIYQPNYYSDLAIQHLRDTYFLPYLNGLTLLLYQYEPCSPLKRQRQINGYLSKPVMPEYKDTPQFKNWLKAERAKKETKRQNALQEDEREDRQLKSEQQKTLQLTNADQKQAKALATQRRQLKYTRQQDQNEQRMKQIETQLSGIGQLKEQLLALKNDIETKDRKALDYEGTYKQLALQCDNLAQQTQKAIEYQTKAIENARETLAIEYQQKTEQSIQQLAIQFEEQQAQQMKTIALGYDKERLETEQKIKDELRAEIGKVSKGNQLTYDNQQREIERLKLKYDQEMREQFKAITDAQETARASVIQETRMMVEVKATQIREQQQKQLTDETKHLHEELNKQQAQAIEVQQEIQELKDNAERRIAVLGRAPVQEVQSPEYLAEIARLREDIAHQGRVLDSMRGRNTQDENRIKQYQEMTDLWAEGLGIKDAKCLADIKKRIQELFVIGVKPEKIKQFLQEFQERFQTLLEHYDEIKAYAKACQETQKTAERIKQRSKVPALTFDTHISYVKNFFREQLGTLYETDTEIYNDLCQWTDTMIEEMAQHGTEITAISEKVKDFPQRFRYFADTSADPRQTWERAFSDEDMPQIIDITNMDNAPPEVIQIKQDFAEYVKTHHIRNEQHYIDAIDTYIDLLWRSLHKVGVIFVAIRHLKAKIDETLKTSSNFKPAFEQALTQIVQEIEQLGAIVGSFEDWANQDLYPELRKQFRFPAEYLVQTIQRIGTLYDMGVSPLIIARIIEHFKTQIRLNAKSQGLDEAFKQASQQITEQAKVNINSFDDKTEQAQRIEDEARELAARDAEWQNLKAWNKTQNAEAFEAQQKAEAAQREEEERKKRESDERWAQNAEYTRQYQEIMRNQFDKRQDFTNRYAKALFEISQYTPLGTEWDERNAREVAEREIAEHGWDGNDIDFTVFPTFQSLTAEAKEYYGLTTFYGKSPDEAMAILRATRKAIEDGQIEEYQRQSKYDRDREFWEDGLPKVLVFNPETYLKDDIHARGLFYTLLAWGYFIAYHRQTINGQPIMSCLEFYLGANDYITTERERRDLDKVGFPIDVSQFDDDELSTYASIMTWMVEKDCVRGNAIELLKKAGKLQDKHMVPKESFLLHTENYVRVIGDILYDDIQGWISAIGISIPFNEAFYIVDELPPETKEWYANFHAWQEWTVDAHMRHDFYTSDDDGRTYYKCIDLQGLTPEQLENEFDRLALVLYILRPHDIDSPIGEMGWLGKVMLDGHCWFLLDDHISNYRQEWVDAVWTEWMWLLERHYVRYYDSNYPEPPMYIHECPFDFDLRFERSQRNSIDRGILARYKDELKAGKWLNILLDDPEHNDILLKRCPSQQQMKDSIAYQAEIERRKNEEAKAEQEAKAKAEQEAKTEAQKTTKPSIDRFKGNGIQSNGVYCYANALFQVLAHIPDFGITDLPVSCQLGELIRAIFTRADAVPTHFVDSILKTMKQYYPNLQWDLSKQQDPHELFSLLANKVYPAMGRLFMVIMAYFANGEQIITPETFLSLPIDINGGILSAFRSEKKGDYGDVETRILEPPAVFMFQVKRFQQGTDRKNNLAVELPTEIDFEQHMAIQTPCLYKLYATINHIGRNRTGGHYVAMINVNMSKLWFLFDDATVSPVKTAEEFNKLKSNAYLAFYVHAELVGSLFITEA